MKKFIVERDIVGLEELTSGELGFVAREANAALAVMSGIQWLQTFIAHNKAFCVFLAEDESLIREHVLTTGFPAAKISEVTEVIDPSCEALVMTPGEKTSRREVTDWFARNRSNRPRAA